MTGTLLTFGEVILRLSPPRGELLLQSPKLDVWVGGAEANVVTQAARLGSRAAIVTALPDNDLGHAVHASLRGHGVDTSRIIFGGERLGLYFVTPGAGVRATDVIYDRGGSSFAAMPAASWHWPDLLVGVDRLHLSGITPALGPNTAEAAVAAAEAAAARGIPVSFDGNWRSKLWARWNNDPRAFLGRIVACADILFGDERDIALLLGRPSFEGDAAERLRRASEAAFAAYPTLRLVAATQRRTTHVNHHILNARIATREGLIETQPIELTDIVDRIGSGDAFVAGVLSALGSGDDVEASLNKGLALGALKHSIAGDAALFSSDHIDAWTAGIRDVRR